MASALKERRSHQRATYPSIPRENSDEEETTNNTFAGVSLLTDPRAHRESEVKVHVAAHRKPRARDQGSWASPINQADQPQRKRGNNRWVKILLICGSAGLFMLGFSSSIVPTIRPERMLKAVDESGRLEVEPSDEMMWAEFAAMTEGTQTLTEETPTTPTIPVQTDNLKVVTSFTKTTKAQQGGSKYSNKVKTPRIRMNSRAESRSRTIRGQRGSSGRERILQREDGGGGFFRGGLNVFGGQARNGNNNEYKGTMGSGMGSMGGGGSGIDDEKIVEIIDTAFLIGNAIWRNIESYAPQCLPAVTPDPTPAPTTPAPTDSPSGSPSRGPTTPPTGAPSGSPSLSKRPSTSPSAQPSGLPSTSRIPSSTPSSNPSGVPSSVPSTGPSATASSPPSRVPSSTPSSNPSSFPSIVPSRIPSSVPSSNPSSFPSHFPSTNPSSVPSLTPSTFPSHFPSNNPSSIPSFVPSSVPSFVPSGNPSSVPSFVPSNGPSSVPSLVPSAGPTTAVAAGTTVPLVAGQSIPNVNVNFEPFVLTGRSGGVTDEPTSTLSEPPSVLPTELPPSPAPSESFSTEPSSAPSTAPPASAEPSRLFTSFLKATSSPTSLRMSGRMTRHGTIFDNNIRPLNSRSRRQRTSRRETGRSRQSELEGKEDDQEWLSDFQDLMGLFDEAGDGG